MLPSPPSFVACTSFRALLFFLQACLVRWAARGARRRARPEARGCRWRGTCRAGPETNRTRLWKKTTFKTASESVNVDEGTKKKENERKDVQNQRAVAKPLEMKLQGPVPFHCSNMKCRYLQHVAVAAVPPPQHAASCAARATDIVANAAAAKHAAAAAAAALGGVYHRGRCGGFSPVCHDSVRHKSHA